MEAKALLDEVKNIQNSNPDFDPLLHKKVLESIEQEYSLSDVGNAERLIHYFGDIIRYNYTNHQWHIWNNKAWVPDESDRIFEYGKKISKYIGMEAGSLNPDVPGDNKNSDNYYKWAASSLNESRIQSAIRLARSDPKVTISQDKFDNDKYILNINNGILELGEINFIKHDPKYLQSKIAPVNFDKEAQYPKWLEFLDKIFDGNKALIDFLARVIGYSLTGDTGERCFFVFWGEGHNGKSTFINTIQALLGPYATTTPFSTFTTKDTTKYQMTWQRLIRCVL